MTPNSNLSKTDCYWVAVRDLQGSSEIPADGYVVSGLGTSGEWLIKNLHKCTQIEAFKRQH